jgi:hypothetical protein
MHLFNCVPGKSDSLPDVGNPREERTEGNLLLSGSFNKSALHEYCQRQNLFAGRTTGVFNFPSYEVNKGWLQH